MMRKMRREDHDDYIRMASDFFSSPAVIEKSDTETHERTFNEIINGDGLVEGFIFEHEGKTAGFAITVRMFQTAVGGTELWLDDIYLLPEYRSLGLTRPLFEYASELLESGEVRRLRLEVEEENEHARALYSRRGFEILDYLQMIKI